MASAGGFDPSALVNQGDFVIIDEEPSERTSTMSIERWLELFNAELIYEQEVPTGPESPPSPAHVAEVLGLSAGWVRALIKRWNTEGPAGN